MGSISDIVKMIPGFGGLNKLRIDLINEDTAKEVIDHFSKNKKCEILTMTTLEKSSISKIKAKLLSYVS